MKIFFRVCEKQETLSYVPRWKNTDKVIMIKKCWLSLMQSVTSEDEIFIVEDQVSEGLLNYLVNTSKNPVKKIYHIPPHGPELPLHFMQFFEYFEEEINKDPDAVYYLCNDDIFHVDNALDIIKKPYRESNWAGFITPMDYPDRYRGENHPSFIFLNSDRHWRTIPSCTGVTTAFGKTWKPWLPMMKKYAKTNSDQYTLEVYKNTPCISPMPGVATHLTEHHMTPLIDWSHLWNKLELN